MPGFVLDAFWDINLCFRQLNSYMNILKYPKFSSKKNGNPRYDSCVVVKWFYQTLLLFYLLDKMIPGHSLYDIFSVQTRILVFCLHTQVFFSIFFSWLRSVKIVFRCDQTYNIEILVNLVNFDYILVFDFKAAPENATLVILEQLEM